MKIVNEKLLVGTCVIFSIKIQKKLIESCFTKLPKKLFCIVLKIQELLIFQWLMLSKQEGFLIDLFDIRCPLFCGKK